MVIIQTGCSLPGLILEALLVPGDYKPVNNVTLINKLLNKDINAYSFILYDVLWALFSLNSLTDVSASSFFNSHSHVGFWSLNNFLSWLFKSISFNAPRLSASYISQCFVCSLEAPLPNYEEWENLLRFTDRKGRGCVTIYIYGNRRNATIFRKGKYSSHL